MKKIDELINSVLAEAKEQKNQRKEYISLVHQLIEGTERKNHSNADCTWRISFRWYSNKMGREMISFANNISERKNGLSDYDVKCLEKADAEIEECINYLLDCGIKVTDAFIEHLIKNAIPQFLQGRYPQDYEIKRDIYTSTLDE